LPETAVGLVAAGSLALLAIVVARASAPAALGLGLVLGVLSLTHSAWQFAGLFTLVALFVHLLVFDRPNIRLAAYAGMGLLAILGPYAVVQVVEDLPQIGDARKGYGAGGAWAVWSGSRAETDFLPTEDSYTVAQRNYLRGGVVVMARLLESGELEIDEHLAETIREKAASPDAATLQLTDVDFYEAALANHLDDPGAWPRKVEQGLKTVLLPAPDLTFYAVPLKTWFREPWRPLAKGLVVLLVLGLALLVVRRRDRLILAVPLALQTAAFLVGVPEHRYGYPLLSGVFILASYAVVSLVCMARQARAESTAPGAA
jgi:hypothetical protein